MPVGIGYDIHRLVDDRKLVLGGVEIHYYKGLLGYSDGDALIHSIADACLGAIGSGDIGEHFPNTDARYKGIESSKLLALVMVLVRDKGFAVENVDATVIAEEPKLYPFKKAMAVKLASVMGIDPSQVNIKATTNEEVGSLGKGEAIASYAVVQLRKPV